MHTVTNFAYFNNCNCITDTIYIHKKVTNSQVYPGES